MKVRFSRILLWEPGGDCKCQSGPPGTVFQMIFNLWWVRLRSLLFCTVPKILTETRFSFEARVLTLEVVLVSLWPLFCAEFGMLCRTKAEGNHRKHRPQRRRGDCQDRGSRLATTLCFRQKLRNGLEKLSISVDIISLLFSSNAVSDDVLYRF